MMLCHRVASSLRKPLLITQNAIRVESCGVKNLPQIVEKRIITQAEVDEFAKLTGDTNFIHSSECPPERRCIHGAFLNAIIGGIIGTKIPGPGSIVVKQEFSFPQKCVTDDEITFLVQLLEDRHIKKIAYECQQKDLVVFRGTANIVVKNVK